MTDRLGLVIVLPLLVAAVLAAVPAAAEDPAKIFAKSCAPCHGKEGTPNAVFAKQGVRDFKDSAWQKAATDAQIEKSIREGRKGTMMARSTSSSRPRRSRASSPTSASWARPSDGAETADPSGQGSPESLGMTRPSALG